MNSALTAWDLRQVVTDNALKDISAEEDGQFIAACNTICGPNNGVGTSGVQQNFLIPGAITRESYTNVLNYIENNNLNNGCILMNRRTAKEFLKFDRSEIGGDLSEAMFKEGLTALFVLLKKQNLSGLLR